MCDEGARWQETLHRQFVALRDQRGQGHVVFALEHGLSSGDLELIRTLVARTSTNDLERRTHWLPWVVHATEVAYAYSGDQYWQSFQEQTPGWDNRNRPWLRTTFSRFTEEYAGPRPTGRWADWFSIISWPITNAVLPNDLQRHLARALYQARHGLASRLGNTRELGEFIASVSWEGSDRFQQLKEQPFLLGQVALALLRPADVTGSLLLPSTLQRIAWDLERERASAVWLSSARRSSERPAIHLSAGRHPRPQIAQSIEDRVRQSARMSAPRLALRPDPTVERTWSAWLSLPNIAPVASVAPEVRAALLESRCWAPAAESPIARGRLLRDRQELRLSSWPALGDPLIRFDGLARGLEAALLAEWMAPDDPVLFSLDADGLGREVVSRTVRGGKAYIVVSRREIAPLEGARVASSLAGCHMYLIQVPFAVDEGLRSMLRKVGVVATKASALWPAGDIPLEWDGETVVQWAANDVQLLGLRPDHDLLALSVDVANGDHASLRNVAAGTVVMVAFRDLPVGVHDVTIRETDTSRVPVSRQIHVAVVEFAGALGEEARPLLVWTEPQSSSLDELWGGTTAVCATGLPTTARLELSLAIRNGAAPLAQKAVRITVPFDEEAWRAVLHRDFVSDQSIAAAFDRARIGRVFLSAGQFGQYQLDFERPLPPVRWHIFERSHHTVLALQDDSDSGTIAKVRYAPFDKPQEFAEVRMNESAVVADGDAAGGLYHASVGSLDALAVIPPARVRSFEALRLTPAVEPPSRTAESLTRALENLDVWARAPLPGKPLARSWRAIVVRALHDTILSVMCGDRWLGAERTFQSRPSDSARRDLQRLVMDGSARTRDVVRSVLDAASRGSRNRVGVISALASLVRSQVQLQSVSWRRLEERHESSTPMWLAEFYLRLATDARCFSWASGSSRDALECSLSAPSLLRVCRLVAVTTGSEVGDAEELSLVAGWRWS